MTSCHVALQLKVKIAKQQAAKEQKLRRKNLTKYIPNAAAAVFKILQSMSEIPAVRSFTTFKLLAKLISLLREVTALKASYLWTGSLDLSLQVNLM